MGKIHLRAYSGLPLIIHTSRYTALFVARGDGIQITGRRGFGFGFGFAGLAWIVAILTQNRASLGKVAKQRVAAAQNFRGPLFF